MSPEEPLYKTFFLKHCLVHAITLITFIDGVMLKKRVPVVGQKAGGVLQKQKQKTSSTNPDVTTDQP